MTDWPQAASANSSKAQKCRELARSAQRPEIISALLELASEFEAQAAASLLRQQLGTAD